MQELEKNLYKKYKIEIILFLLSCTVHLLVSIFLYNKFGNEILYFENEDAHSYVNMAKSVVAGEGFSRGGVVSAIRMPAYPLLLALIFFLHVPFVWSVLVVHNIIASLTVVMVYRLGAMLFSPRVGKIAASIYMVEPYLLMTANLAITETFFNFLLVLFAYSFLRCLVSKNGGQQRWLVVCGILMGLLILTKPVALYLSVMIVFILLIQYVFVVRDIKAFFKTTAIVMSLVVATLSPWLLRQYYHYHRLQITTSNAYMLYYKIAPLVVASQENISYDVATEVLRQRLKEQFLEYTDEDVYNSFRYYDAMISEAKRLIKDRPLVVAKQYFLSLIPGLFGTGYEYMLENIAGIQRSTPRVNFTSLIAHRDINAFVKALIQVNIFQLALLGGAALWFIVYWLIVVSLLSRDLWKRHGLALLTLIMLIGYFVFFSLGPASHARYRTPSFPFIFLLLGLALDFFVKRRMIDRVTTRASSSLN